MLYAKSLDIVIREEVTDKNESLTYSKLMRIVTNGTRIVETMTKKNSPYKSKLQFCMHFVLWAVFETLIQQARNRGNALKNQ